MSITESITRLDLEPVGGVAGDMFAATLIDAFPELLPRVQRDLCACPVPDGVGARVEEARNAGFRGARFVVEQATDTRPPRTLSAVQEFLHAGDLREPVRRHAEAIFTLLAEAEAQVHGASLESVHFHEVSDWDSVVDIVSASSLAHALDGACWRVGALPLGGGTIRTAHGDIPVPAPAAAHLLRGFRWVDDGVPGERVTPTGAAILAHLCPAPCAGASPTGVLQRIGVGCGSRTLPGRANILRLTAFSAPGSDVEQDLVERLAFEVDDMSGEELAIAMEHLRATPGVLDVVQIPLLGKKGRSALGIRLIVAPAEVERVVRACFEQTSTLGLRQERVLRRILPRQQMSACLENSTIHAKRAERPGGAASFKVDSDTLAGVSTLEERRSLARRATDRLAEDTPHG